jgi:hypothetical protein
MTAAHRGYQYAGIHVFADAARALTAAGLGQDKVEWLCGECDSPYTVEADNGGRSCETCGALYDHAGHPLLLPEYWSECLSPDVQEWLSRRL